MTDREQNVSDLAPSPPASGGRDLPDKTGVWFRNGEPWLIRDGNGRLYGIPIRQDGWLKETYSNASLPRGNWHAAPAAGEGGAQLRAEIARLREENQMLAAQRIAIARAYDPNCDEYVYEDELEKMKAARQTIEAVQELAVSQGRDPEGCLIAPLEDAMGLQSQLTTAAEREQRVRALVAKWRESNRCVGYCSNHERCADELESEIGGGE